MEEVSRGPGVLNCNIQQNFGYSIKSEGAGTQTGGGDMADYIYWVRRLRKCG